MTEQTLHPLMKCIVKEVTYDFKEKRLHVKMEKGDCVDMTGSIEFAKKIDDGVTSIITYSGEEIDTSYFKRDDGEWNIFLRDKSN